MNIPGGSWGRGWRSHSSRQWSWPKDSWVEVRRWSSRRSWYVSMLVSKILVQDRRYVLGGFIHDIVVRVRSRWWWMTRITDMIRYSIGLTFVLCSRICTDIAVWVIVVDIIVTDIDHWGWKDRIITHCLDSGSISCIQLLQVGHKLFYCRKRCHEKFVQHQ